MTAGGPKQRSCSIEESKHFCFGHYMTDGIRYVIDNRVGSKLDPFPIRSIGEYLANLVENEAHPGEIRWYRGHRTVSWDVQPTIWRKFSADEERNFVHRFRSRAAIRMTQPPGYHEFAHWLSLMRHYGLPTRLMDWSRSPLVALYFALEYLFEDPFAEASDSLVWVLLPHSLNEVQNLDNIGNLTPSINSGSVRPLLEGAFYQVESEIEGIAAVMAHDVDLRIFVQQGCFTVHSRKVALNLIDGHGVFLRPLLIPAKYARQMAYSLFVAGMRKGDIYPDLDNLAAEIVETHQYFGAV